MKFHPFFLKKSQRVKEGRETTGEIGNCFEHLALLLGVVLVQAQQQHHLLRMQQDNTSAISLSNHEHPKVKPAVSFRRTVQLHFRVTKQEIPNGYLGGHSHSNRDEAISLSEPQPLHTYANQGQNVFSSRDVQALQLYILHTKSPHSPVERSDSRSRTPHLFPNAKLPNLDSQGQQAILISSWLIGIASLLYC